MTDNHTIIINQKKRREIKNIDLVWSEINKLTD